MKEEAATSATTKKEYRDAGTKKANQAATTLTVRVNRKAVNAEDDHPLIPLPIVLKYLEATAQHEKGVFLDKHWLDIPEKARKRMGGKPEPTIPEPPTFISVADLLEQRAEKASRYVTGKDFTTSVELTRAKITSGLMAKYYEGIHDGPKLKADADLRFEELGAEAGIGRRTRATIAKSKLKAEVQA